MTFADLSAGESIFLDANPLVYHALIVAVMQANGLARLASSDHDFDRVPGLTRYEPN